MWKIVKIHPEDLYAGSGLEGALVSKIISKQENEINPGWFHGNLFIESIPDNCPFKEDWENSNFTFYGVKLEKIEDEEMNDGN